MSALIVACALGAVALIVTWVMAAVGLMGIADAMKFRNCDGCSRWTIASKKYGATCHHCRPHDSREHALALHLAMPLHLRRPHFGH